MRLTHTLLIVASTIALSTRSKAAESPQQLADIFKRAIESHAPSLLAPEYYLTDTPSIHNRKEIAAAMLSKLGDSCKVSKIQFRSVAEHIKECPGSHTKSEIPIVGYIGIDLTKTKHVHYSDSSTGEKHEFWVTSESIPYEKVNGRYYFVTAP